MNVMVRDWRGWDVGSEQEEVAEEYNDGCDDEKAGGVGLEDCR